MSRVCLMQLTPIKRHLVPAYYNWLCENDPKVFIVFVLNTKNAMVSPAPPEQLIVPIETTDPTGKMIKLSGFVINTNPEAVSHFAMSDTDFTLQCRIGGKVHHVQIPFDSVLRLECPNIKLTQGFELDMNCIVGYEEEQVLPEAPRATPFKLVRIK